MNSIVEFVIRLKALPGNIQAVANQTSNELDRVRRKAEGVSSAISRAFSPSTLGQAVHSLPGGALLTNPYAMVGAAIGAVARIGSEAEMASTHFERLVGNQELSASMLDEIWKFADSTPFSRMQLTKEAGKMLNFGVATDQVVGRLKQLSDISGGNYERLESLALVFGQVSSAGYLMGQDLIQFFNAGFNPVHELSNMTGKSYADLREYMVDRRITAENVAQAIDHATQAGGKFHGVTEAISNTLRGKFFRTIGDLVGRTISLFNLMKPVFMQLLDFFNMIMPVVFDSLEGLLRKVYSLVGTLKGWGDELALLGQILGIFLALLASTKIGVIALALKVKVASTAMAAWAAIVKVFNLVMAANPILRVIGLIAALVAGVVYAYNKFDGFRELVDSLWKSLKDFGQAIYDYVINRINDLLDAIGAVGQAVKLLFEGDFSGAADSVSHAYDRFLGRNRPVPETPQLGHANLARYMHETYDQYGRKFQFGQPVYDNPIISPPSLKGSKEKSVAEEIKVVFGPAQKKGRSGSGNAIATGGQRNTTINMTIGKLIENIYVRMMDKASTAELEQEVLRSVNRALGIATSAER